MRRHLTSALVLLLAALGLAAGLLSGPARADGPVQLADLSALGYTLGIRADLSIQPICSNYWVLSGNGAPETLIGDPSHSYCQTPEQMQSRIDALIAAYPPPVPQPPAAPETTTTTSTDQTPPASAPEPAPTTTTTAADPAPTVTTTDPAPAAQPAAVTPVATASLEALTAAQGSGASDAVAAMAARSAGENAVYGL